MIQPGRNAWITASLRVIGGSIYIRPGRYLQHIGSRAGDLRIGRRLTQAQLSDTCGLHRTFIGSVERGEGNAAILSMRRIAAALRVPLADLVGARLPGSHG
jgi:DNA-binding XRE family transcriptional regulator